METGLSVAVVKPHSSMGYVNCRYMNFPPMGGPLITKFLKEKGYEARFIDLDHDNLDPGDYDVVLISMLTTEAPEGYELADVCRNLGIPVIGGGYHATFNSDEARKHFDVVVKGDGIPTILEAINYARKGGKGVLEGEVCSAERLGLTADGSVIDMDWYSKLNFIVTSFGCPHSCSFCCNWKMYGKRVFRKGRDVIENEVRNFKKGMLVFFLDDDLNLVNPDVFKLLKKHNYKFVGQAGLDFVKSDGFRLAVDCGLVGLALGFEAIDEGILKRFDKMHGNDVCDYDSIIRTVKKNNIALFGFFILDPDMQGREDMEQLVEYAINKGFDFVQFSLLTPFPGTELRKQIKGRVFDNNWQNYTTLKCVFHPRKMSHEEADKMVENAYKKFYSIRSMLKRMLRTKRPSLFFAGNITAWMATRRVWR